jgi:hypothetical protein
MNEFDDAIRRAVRHSIMNSVVPKPPRFIREPVLARRPEPRRWAIYVAAALSLAFLLTAFVGRSALAELENTVSAAIRFFEADTNGQLRPIESQSLTLGEALQTQAFRVVAPTGLPPQANLQSIQRLGAGSSTVVIFTYLYGGKIFSLLESPASSATTGNIIYSARPALPMSGNHTFGANPGMQFRIQATVWISGSARVELFATNVLAPDQIARVEHAMERI